jgi:hypothetical protein
MSVIPIKNGSKFICTYRVDNILIKNTYSNMSITEAKFLFAEYCMKLLVKYNV